MERGVGDVEGEAGGAQTGMAEQQWDATQVDPGFEQMGRKCVPLMPSSALTALCRAPSYAG